MNKNVIIGVVGLIVLGGVVAYFLKGQNASTTGSNAFTSIKDALSKSVSLECNYSDKDGKQSKSYIKNGAVRVDMKNSQNPDESASIIMKDKKMYSWTAKKIGFMMDLPEEEMDNPEVAVSEGSEQKEDIISDLEKYKDACKPAVVSDNLFTPPADVKFTNLSEMLGEGEVPGVDPTIVEKYRQESEDSKNATE